MPTERPGLVRAVLQGVAVATVLSACTAVDRAWPVVRHPGSLFKHPAEENGGAAPPAGEVSKSQVDAINAKIKDTTAQCRASLDTPELEPIRHKVELHREEDAAVPFEIVTNNTFPTDEERPVIARWATLRDECTRHLNALSIIPPNANEIQVAFLQQVQTFHREARATVSELMLPLYEQKLTYGEFGRKRYEIESAAAAADHAFHQAAEAKDDQRLIETTQTTQAQFETTRAGWAKYIHAVNARRPKTVRMDGKKPVTR